MQSADAPQSPTLHTGPARRSRNGQRKLWWGIGVVAVLVVASQAARLSPDQGGVVPSGDLAPVLRGPLTISVASAGSIRSENAKIIKNKVEGRTTILWIIEEGTQVQAGDKLMELDASELDDERLEEEIEVETSRAAHINAEQMLEIAKKQGQADIEAAGVAYRLAMLDIEKYAGIDAEEYQAIREAGGTLDQALEGSLLAELNEAAGKVADSAEERARFKDLLDQMDGSYKVEMQKALNEIVLADAELRRAQDFLADSRELFALDFIAQTQLQADELDCQRRAIQVETAVDELELLARFTYRRTMEELSSAVNHQRFELEKAEHEAAANLVDAQANLHARKERLVRDELNLKEIMEQLAACIIIAPDNGLVVYGTTGRGGGRDDRQEPLAEGVEVREQQDLFRLPTTDGLVADIKIHESMLEKVDLGLPVHLTTDALPGRSFRAVITKIAPLPDAQSRWMNPDLKVYNTIAEVIGDPGDLRTGMSCRSEIIVAEFEDTLYLPIQAVVRVEGQSTVYLPDSNGELVARNIEVGLDDNRMMQVISGLEEGDLVSLTPPLEEGATSLADEWIPLPEGLAEAPREDDPQESHEREPPADPSGREEGREEGRGAGQPEIPPTPGY